MYALTIDLKRGHEFEGKQGGVYGRVLGGGTRSGKCSN